MNMELFLLIFFIYIQNLQTEDHKEEAFHSTQW